ncbi:MAG: BglG family transcription antiterminator [Ruminococcus sp.]|jgi:mannitol operon transcriptional antiterminator
MHLTPRAKEIIYILIHFPQNHPVTISAISEELGVSSRSIQRELVTVEQWLNENGFRFIRKRSVGLMLDEPEDRKKELLTLLQSNSPKKINVDDRRERQNLLCHFLLFSDEPVKSFYLASKLKISEGTLLADLNQITPWFEKYQLHLNRRQGLGIYIEGPETSRRQAAASCLFDQITRNLQSEPGRSISDSWNSYLIQDIDPSIVKNTSMILSDCEKQLKLHLSDNEYLRLLIYLVLAVHRILKGYSIPDGDSIFSQKSMEPEYAVADYLTRLLRKQFEFPPAAAETGYLAAYLTGIHIWPAKSMDLTRRRDFDIHQVTLKIIKSVGDELHLDFSDDSRLLKDLEGHLQPAIGRLRAGITIENPLLEEFQEKYGDVYRACEKGAGVLKEMFDIPEVYASEIGFITIYFVMALERKEKLERKISAILVCPSGIGSSRLLASNLKKEYPDLDIRGTMSAFEIDCEKLYRDRVDLVISTIKLSIPYHYLQVNPILTRQDKMLLNSKLTLLQQKKRQDTPEITVPAPPLARGDVEYISKLGTEIYHLLDNIRIGQAPVLGKRQEVISYAASLFAENEEMEKHFHLVLQTRDQMADTYIKPFHALLLHGRSSMTDHVCFGYVRLEPPVYDKTQIILGAIVSLIPEGPDSQVCGAVTSEVIGALLEKPELLNALRSMDDTLFVNLLESTLLRFYRETVKNRLRLPAISKKD